MRSKIIVALLLAGAGGAAASATVGQPAAALQPVVACRSLADGAARLRCYDEAVQQLADRSASGAIVVASREEVKQARRSAFGLTLPKLPFFNNAASEDEEPQEIAASIRSARLLGNGLWELNLDAAGVWRTTEALTSARIPKQAQQVQIRKGALGSYFIRMTDGRSVKGLRVR